MYRRLFLPSVAIWTRPWSQVSNPSRPRCHEERPNKGTGTRVIEEDASQHRPTTRIPHSEYHYCAPSFSPRIYIGFIISTAIYDMIVDLRQLFLEFVHIYSLYYTWSAAPSFLRRWFVLMERKTQQTDRQVRTEKKKTGYDTFFAFSTRHALLYVYRTERAMGYYGKRPHII